MTNIPQEQLAGKLDEANRRLEFWLHRLHEAVARGTPLSADKMNGLLAELRWAGQLLGSVSPADRSAVLSSALAAYRQKLEPLREFLPTIQRQLLLEKLRLEVKRNQLDATAEWARRSRQTLARR